MDLYNFTSWDIYNNKGRFKVFILIMAVIIGGVSIYYTHGLVKDLAAREQNLIDLYAKGLKFVADSKNEGDLTFIFQEIIESNKSIPAIMTDDKENPISEMNISFPKNFTEKQKQEMLVREVQEMKLEHPPIVVEFAPGERNYIFYKNSFLLRQLLYYPYVQLTVIFIFALIAYLAFSSSRNSEQNRVWVGLAKETAHQLGTPLSSLMAWIELFKSDPRYQDAEIVKELEKDVNRLEMITSRFSNIGSVPALQDENILKVVQESTDYLKTRVSSKVRFSVSTKTAENATARINKPLFEWVIENVCKNAVDAMNGIGSLDLEIIPLNDKKVAIDIRDTGKGIPRSKFNAVFQPGYTTKKRGWGLGLTLVKRIVDNYHKGRIYVHSSEPGKGTTFRIIVNS
ncbi:MAG: sensor histidine kinase [Cytophagaceae bacterium]